MCEWRRGGVGGGTGERHIGFSLDAVRGGVALSWMRFRTNLRAHYLLLTLTSFKGQRITEICEIISKNEISLMPLMDVSLWQGLDMLSLFLCVSLSPPSLNLVFQKLGIICKSAIITNKENHFLNNLRLTGNTVELRWLEH